MPTVSKKRSANLKTRAANAISANHQEHFVMCSNTHLACTVETSSQGCQCHNYSPAVVAFDGIERSDARQGPHPAQLFL